MIRDDELIIDSFAGGGGASTGIFMATGRHPDVAINHDPEAVAMHKANHPQTEHYCQSIYKVDPDDIIRKHKRPIGLAWFSPDCTHHSKARGGKPKEKHIRDLAWVVVHWAERAVYKGQRPRIIAVENVEEFKDWGPLLEDGKPCPVQKGQEFQRWVKALQKLGYKVEWRELRASEYGAPTIRKRLFMVARCDGEPIVWPKPTHGPGTDLPFRTAGECIDWTIPCPSIFLTKEQGKAIRVKRPLAEKTMKRVARGIRRFVLDAKEPFIVNLTHQGGDRIEATTEPFKTITGANRGEKALVSPLLAGVGGRAGQSAERSVGSPYHTTTSKADTALVATELAPFITEHANGTSPRSWAADEPLRTQCAQVKGGHFALAAASLVQTGYGEREGQEPRALDPNKPLGTVVAGGGKHAACAAYLAQYNSHGTGEPNVGHSAEKPMSTILTNAPQRVVAAQMVKLRGTCRHGQPCDEPLATVSAQGQHMAAVTGSLVAYYGSEKDGSAYSDPLRTITSNDRFGAMQAGITIPPLSEEQKERAREVANLLRTYGLWDDREFVTLEWGGSVWVIADIGLRMLKPHELYAAQGFPSDYIIDPMMNGKPLSATAQVRMCGNSVSPWPAAALISAQLTGARKKAKPVQPVPYVPPHLLFDRLDFTMDNIEVGRHA